MIVRVVSSEFGAILADLRTIIRIYFLVEPHLRSLNGLMPPLLLSFLLDRLCMFYSLHSLLYPQLLLCLPHPPLPLKMRSGTPLLLLL